MGRIYALIKQLLYSDKIPDKIKDRIIVLEQYVEALYQTAYLTLDSVKHLNNRVSRLEKEVLGIDQEEIEPPVTNDGQMN